MDTTYFEDVSVGTTYDCGSYDVTKREIVEFAERWDPQPFHLDEEAAAETIYGGLIASGWHTAAIVMRLMHDGFISKTSGMGAIGVDELRWRRPVRPGDTLSLEIEVVELAEWNDRFGVVHSKATVTKNGDDDPVYTMIALPLVERRSWTAEGA